jgi:serine/threonine-protein kinase
VTQARINKIGKYEVESVVGEGAMGVVYCAVDSMLNRRVAIKVMSDAIAQDKDLRERFLREAQAAGSLQHPNVVTIYDFGEIDGHLYIAMEYVEGEDLEDLLRSTIPLPLEARLELVIGVLQGLAFAHRRGVVHRDIKPANIRVDQDGKARIMDFGVAHLASSDMTRTGTMLGTPSYMAPEQIIGGPVSPETDIFSVGAVLYELLTNIRPFKGDTLQTLMYQILSTTPPPLSQVAPTLPAELNRIVSRALQKDPKERYPNALEMANDLMMVKTSNAHDGTFTSLSLRRTIDTAIADRHAGIRQTARRKQATMVGAGAIGLALILGLGYQVWQWNSAPDIAEGGTPLVSASAEGTLPEPGATPPAPDSLADSTPPASTPPASKAAAPAEPLRPPVQTVQKAGSAPRPTGPTAQEIALARNVQRVARDGRRRASDAGASPDQLRAGDSQESSGEALLRAGRTLDAADAFNRAAAAWAIAERTARDDAAARIAAAAARASSTVADSPATPPAPRPEVARLTVPEAPAGSSTAPVPPPVPAAPSPAVTGAAINAIIASYARAIESRDIAELRRAYPGMTTDQRRAFEDFFGSTRSLRAALAVSDLQVDGASAEARLTGTYEYVTTAGNTERRPVSFRATLRREGEAWKLMVVR